MVRIITDSAADFEPAELEKLNISCIPLSVMLDGKSYRENLDLGKKEFYELLASTGDTPQTSQPAPNLLFELFRDAKNAGDEAVYITISSGISGTYQTALITLEDVECDDCYVVDSLSATAGERLLVEYAVRLRDEGKSAKEIVAAVEAVRGNVVLTACIDTLEYLYRGGRISQTVYKLGTMAQVKPIIRFTAEGTIEVPAKAMGMRKGMDQLCKRLETQKPHKNHKIYAVYTADKSIGETLAQRMAAHGYEIPDDQIVPVGAVIGSHIGPGACGLIYIAE